jgi:hypothetical protein
VRAAAGNGVPALPDNDDENGDWGGCEKDEMKRKIIFFIIAVAIILLAIWYCSPLFTDGL